MNYKDRNGTITTYNSKQDNLLKLLYSHKTGRILLKFLTHPILSKLGGRFLNTKISTSFIKSFVKNAHIDLSQYKTTSFQSYNAFFTRQIKSEFRPIVKDKNVLISPCDGKLSVYPIHENIHFHIKNTTYSVESLLHSKKFATYFKDGYVAIFRLTVDDYHRFCYMDDGKKSNNYVIPGVLHTVNPIANDFYPIYKENTREYCLLNSKHFGVMLVMEVGALIVGKIKNYHQKKEVKKGEEKGRFEFGGSTIVVLLQKQHVILDYDLLANTEHGYETLVKMGEQIGIQAKTVN